MTKLNSDFVDLLGAFASCGVEYLVVGGYAVAFHARPRATKDIDLWIATGADNLRKTARALRQFGAPAVVIEALRSSTPNDVIWMGQPPRRVDILQHVDGVEFSSCYERRIRTTWDGVEAVIIGLDDLLASKRAAGRPQDLLDVAELVRSGRASR